MASNSLVRKGESISWDFIEPFDNTFQDSPLFEIFSSKWMLKFHLYYDQQSLVNHYSITLINCNGTNLFKPFEITTYLQYTYDGKQHKCSHLTVKSAFTTLWIGKQHEIKEKLDLKYYPDGLTVICVFFPSKKNLTYLTEMNDQSTQVVSEFSSSKMSGSSLLIDEIPDDDSIISLSTQETSGCFNCMIRNGSPPPHKSPDNSAEKFLNSLSNFESLSKDIGGMLSNSLMTDIELKCEEIIIPVHRAILAARSEVLATMIKNTVENSSRTINIEDIEPSTLQEFLKYLYSGSLCRDLSTDIISKLHLTSYKYSVLTLQRECSILIAEKLSAENFIMFLKIADALDDKLLKDAIADFIVGHPFLLECDNWIKFSDDFPRLSVEIYKKCVKKAFT